MNKKFTASILAGIMALSLCACDNGVNKPSIDEPAPEITAQNDGNSEAENNTEAAETEAAAPAAECNTVTKFWKANIPDNLKEDEDVAKENDTYSYHCYKETDDDGKDVKYVKITVEEEKVLNFRSGLLSNGITMQDYSEGKCTTEKIAGLDFVVFDMESEGDSESEFEYRAEPAGMTVNITTKGYEQSDVKGVIDSLSLTLPDSGLTDPLYPWEGDDDYILSCGNESAGSYTLTAKQLVTPERILPNNVFNSNVIASGDYVYVLIEQTLYIYKYNDGKLESESVETFAKTYDDLSVDKDGNVYISAFIGDLLKYKDGKKVGEFAGLSGHISVSPDGTWGIKYFSNPDDLKLITLNSDYTYSEDEFTLSESSIKGAGEVFVTENYVAINSTTEDDNNERIRLFDKSGNLKKTLSNSEDGMESLSSIKGFVETANGFMGISWTWKDVIVWDNSNEKAIASVDAQKLFGTGNTTSQGGLCKLKDGSYAVSLIDTRPDESWYQVLIVEIDSDC